MSVVRAHIIEYLRDGPTLFFMKPKKVEEVPACRKVEQRDALQFEKSLVPGITEVADLVGFVRGKDLGVSQRLFEKVTFTPSISQSC